MSPIVIGESVNINLYVDILSDNFFLITRYSTIERDNCQLCDRQINLLDFYADIEPDRDYDIYAMSDDPQMCSKTLPSRQNNARMYIECGLSFDFWLFIRL